MFFDLVDVWDLYVMLRERTPPSSKVSLQDVVSGLDLIGVRDVVTRSEYAELLRALDEEWFAWQRSNAPAPDGARK